MELLWALYAYFAAPILTVLFWVLIIWGVASWLVAFGVINTRNPNVRMILGFLDAVCQPMCRPIRRIIPPLNGVLDLSPLIVLLVIVFVRDYALPTLIGFTGAPRV